MKNRKMGVLSDFEREQIVGARLAGASVTKTGKLLGVSTVTVSKVMSAYTNHGKTTSVSENNSDRKRSSQNCAAEVTAELNIHLEDPVSTKNVRREPHKSSVHGRAVIAKRLITESNAQVRKRK
jgi:hypothetical protein